MLNFFGFGNSQNNISPAEAKRELDSDKNIILLDVRTKQEYDQGHIPDSILMPLNKLSNSIETKVSDKDQKIFVYCMSGSRSSSAVRKLEKMGYTNVYNLGGITSWPYEKE